MTQATTFTRGYDPATGKELWKLAGNSEITIPTPIAGPGFVIVTNGYRGVQPIFAIKPGASGDITLKDQQTKSDFIAWSTNRGGPYIPTPVVYGDQLYVLLNNGVLAAYKVATGERVYQERLGGTGGSFSASPVAADGKLYLTSEDGDVFVRQSRPDLRAPGEELDGRDRHGHAGYLRRHHHRAWIEERVCRGWEEAVIGLWALGFGLWALAFPRSKA